MGKLLKKIERRMKKILLACFYGSKLFFSTSFNGEDTFLQLYFHERKKGFYIDIGAHDPVRYSNTFFLYKKGWSGINIDVKPGCMKKFNRLRKRDINVEAGISNREYEIDYYSFKLAPLNTFDKSMAEKRIESGNELIEVKKIRTQRLEDVLKKYCRESSIQFMSVDVEGLEVEVLKSNNWELYRPEIIIVEYLDNESNMEDIMQSTLCKFMLEKDYIFYARFHATCVFREHRSI